MNLELYYFATCPFCQMVLRYIHSNEIQVTLKDIRKNREYNEELSKLNHGVTQVPCLVIDGESMLESDDIIEYLKTLVK